MSDRDPLQSIWTNQTQEPFTMSLADIHTHAERFQSRIRLRNVIEYVAAGFVVTVFAWMAVTIPAPIVQSGAVLIILGALYVCWQLYLLGRAAIRVELDRAVSLADFHRAELVRQRTALSTVWRWYLAPFAPGMLVFIAGVAFEPELDAPFAERLALFAIWAGFIGLTFAAIAWLNAVAVRRLDKEIDALERSR